MTDLRDIVNAATPGPWVAESEYVSAPVEGGRSNGEVILRCRPSVVWVDMQEENIANARFIATFDPTMVAALLDVVDAARALHELKVGPRNSTYQHLKPQAWADLAAALAALEDTP